MITALLLAYVGISAAVTVAVAVFLGRSRERVAASLPVRNETNLRLVTRDDDGTRLDRAA
jgi:hypothetical protein